MVAGGFSDLPDLAQVNTTIEMTPGTGETVRIVRSSQADVADGMLAVQILNEEFTRGAGGTVRFTVENTGEEEIEIVTARNSGSAASDQLYFYLLDEDDNVIATKALKQALGDMLVTLSNKNTVARIPAGATFTSAPQEINVPANAPDNISIKLSIASIYYHQGQETQVQMAGLSTSHPVTLVDTAYYGEIVSITPESAVGGQDISIVGRAVERATGEPLAGVPLNLVITLNGFERKYEVFSGIDGTFTHVFEPLAGESGIYKVRAVHPDLTDKPVMGQFVITRVSVTPTTINLNQPKNYTKTIGIKVTSGEGTVANNLHLEYSAADQPAGDYPQGVHLTIGSPVAALSAKTTAILNLAIFADNSAAATETLKLKVISDEGTCEGGVGHRHQLGVARGGGQRRDGGQSAGELREVTERGPGGLAAGQRGHPRSGPQHEQVLAGEREPGEHVVGLGKDRSTQPFGPRAPSRAATSGPWGRPGGGADQPLAVVVHPEPGAGVDALDHGGPLAGVRRERRSPGRRALHQRGGRDLRGSGAVSAARCAARRHSARASRHPPQGAHPDRLCRGRKCTNRVDRRRVLRGPGP